MKQLNVYYCLKERERESEKVGQNFFQSQDSCKSCIKRQSSEHLLLNAAWQQCPSCSCIPSLLSKRLSQQNVREGGPHPLPRQEFHVSVQLALKPHFS